MNEDFENFYPTWNLCKTDNPSPEMLELYLLLNKMSDRDIGNFFRWFSPFPNFQLDGPGALWEREQSQDYEYTEKQRELLAWLRNSPYTYY